ncbi:methyl-accepting chemotaxis protein, partial [Blastochloris sulfoviridis]
MPYRNANIIPSCENGAFVLRHRKPHPAVLPTAERTPGEGRLVMRFNLKIGQKLGISAAIGMALVLTLVVVSRVALDRIDNATNSLERAATLVGKLTDSKLDLRDMRSLFYQASVATSVEGIDKVVAEFDKIAPALSQRVGDVAATASVAANRERMVRAKTDVDGYIATWREAAARQRDLLQVQKKLMGVVDAWGAELAKVQAVSSRLGADTATLLERIDGRVAEARSAIWRFYATEDERLKDQVRNGVETALSELRDLQAKDPSPQLAAILPALAKLAEQHREVFDAASAAAAQRAAAVKKAGAVRVEVTQLVDETLDAASAFAASLNRDVDSAVASADTSGLILGALTVLVLIGSTVFGFLAVGRPISRIAGVLEQLAGGDKSVEIPFTRRGDEVGDTARAANVFKDNLIRMDQMTAEQKAAEARAEAEKKQAMHQLAEGFERAVGGIIGAVSSASSQLQGAAQTMSAAAEQTNRQSMAVASASEQASSNVQTVASAAEELAASVTEIGRRVNESASIAAEAARDADATAQKVGRLSQAAQKIGDIVGLISTIAGQTNLLALN